MGPSAKRRKLQNYGVEEVKFDSSARQDYLTGFHKRKQARIQHAQKVAAERGRQEKLEERKQLREQRKQELEDHVKAVNEAVKKAEVGHYDSDEERNESQNESKSANSDREDDDERFGQDHQSVEAREEQYVDEEKYTTVIVEPMNADSHDDDIGSDDDEGSGMHQGFGKPKNSLIEQQQRGRQPAGRETKASVKLKKRKPRFHYETKSERKLTQSQQTLKKRKAAAARRAAKRG